MEIDDEDSSTAPRYRDVLSQSGTTISGLNTGTGYRFRVFISENDTEVATSRIATVEIPVVTAIPSYSIDNENPYVVHFHAWKPAAGSGDTWRFSWIINNMEIMVQNSQDFSYEFGTRGRKTIQLKVYDSLDVGSASNYNISDPFYVDIKTDILPVIEYVLAEDGGYIELSCENSLGYNIDYAGALWSLTGPDGSLIQLSGPAVIADISGFSRKLNVNLNLPRIPVNGQQATDTIVKTRVIDLDYTDLKPVITYRADDTNSRLVTFSGQESMGNIDWYRARWSIFADNAVIYQVDGLSTFAYQFSERNSNTIYSVSLTIPRRSDGTTDTISQLISIEAAPIEPEIDYEVLALTRDGNVVGQKIIFDCTGSSGSGIEFSQARWSVPMAADFGNQAIQTGPTATYNLTGIAEGMTIDVALTLTRAGGTDAKTVTRLISVTSHAAPASKLVVNETTEDSLTGQVLVLDVLSSTGPNIDWERTDWLIDGQYTRKGPVVRYDVSASAEGTVVTYTCVLYRHGGEPETVTGQYQLGETMIYPLITTQNISETQPNVYSLSVLDTRGVNIDWDRTRWYIYDNNQEVVIKQGAEITHAFSLSSDKLGYPVLVEMFLKGDTRPFTKYLTIDVEGDELLPVITTLVENPDNPAQLILSAESSTGSGIDWQLTKWTFIDSAEVAYGPVVNHQFPSHAEAGKKEYMVALTLYRRRADGTMETVTGTKAVTVGSDEIVPRIKAQLKGDYLVLSAEESSGHGLLLDRCVWSFPGEGDSVTENVSTQGGTLFTNNLSTGISAQITAGNRYNSGLLSAPGFFYEASIQAHIGNDLNITTYGGNYEERTDSFSASNYHTGPICRRHVPIETDWNYSLAYQDVTLYVYRHTDSGGIEGKSITVRLNISELENSQELSFDATTTVE